jgi:hydroxyacylglutathione hydrolase
MQKHRDPFGSRADILAGGTLVYVLKIRFNYCYLIVNRQARQAIAVDPAWDGALIEEVLRSEGVRLSCVAVTHSHFDHIHLADAFSRKYDCPVFMSQEEADFYRVSFNHLQHLRHGKSVHVAGMTVQPLLTPGHTWGGTCLYVNGCLFSGDTLFAEGCGMCVGAGADPRMMYHSLRMLRTTMPEATRVYPGHSYGVAPGASMAELCQYNIYLNIEGVEQFVRFRMRIGQSGLFDFR